MTTHCQDCQAPLTSVANTTRYCHPCARKRKRASNTAAVKLIRARRKPKLDRMDMRAIELFRREGWDEDPIWARTG
ncbi:MAG: hypothetical protein IPM02_25830 [Betaproteobacteria bacterium]|nr:hypothetical protein [Betaproteobacteria bacterium]